MQTERRCVQRKTSRGISYLEFEAGSGGIILDASEKGLGFQAAGEVQQLGPSRMWIWISPRPEERIEITGNVVWTDSSNGTGGLRFIETGADSCNQIRTWLWPPTELEVSPQFQQFPWPARSAEKPPEVRRETRHNANLPRSPVASRAKSEFDLSLLAGGVSAGAALAVLIAGPAINLASLLVIARQSHWKVALLVAVAVWVTAVAAGLLIG